MEPKVSNYIPIVDGPFIPSVIRLFLTKRQSVMLEGLDQSCPDHPLNTLRVQSTQSAFLLRGECEVLFVTPALSGSERFEAQERFAGHRWFLTAFGLWSSRTTPEPGEFGVYFRSRNGRVWNLELSILYKYYKLS